MLEKLMKTISGFILKNILSWKINGKFPEVQKSIVIFAPHTSYFDAIIGKLYINEIGIKHVFLSKKELFYFPMNIVMKCFGSIPVRGVTGKNAIFLVNNMLKESESLHIILSPEGTLAKVASWKKGFYYMAKKANVPIIVGYIDYQKKEIGIKCIINDTENVETVMRKIKLVYNDVTAKYPKKFSKELIS